MRRTVRFPCFIALVLGAAVATACGAKSDGGSDAGSDAPPVQEQCYVGRPTPSGCACGEGQAAVSGGCRNDSRCPVAPVCGVGERCVDYPTGWICCPGDPRCDDQPADGGAG